MTSTIVSTPRLSEVARHLVIPEGVTTSLFPKIERRLKEADVTFDVWQRGAGQVSLGCRADGKLAATVGGVVWSWPRQVGKTYSCGGIQVGDCLEFPGTRVAWTSHHNRTTTNTFRVMQGLVRRPKVWPHIAAIRTANGEQEIVFVNGSIIMFGAREQGFGRGMDKLDRLIFDEAQILGLKALEDMVPATNQAQHPHGGLVYFIGTPPRPIDDGEAFTAKRDRALLGKSCDQVYIELSADVDADPYDASAYSSFNPSFPLRTPIEAMQRMLENIPDPDSVRREMMGIWPVSAGAVISVNEWAALAATGPENGVKPTVLAVDMSHRREISIAACWHLDDGLFVEEVWAGADSAAALEWLIERAGRRIPVLIDAVSPAASLVPGLKAARANVTVTSATDMAKACGLVYDMAKAGTLLHGEDQEALSAAVAGARKRPIRDAGGWGWDRRDETVNIAPLVAVTLAVLGASSTRKKSNDSQGRRVVVL